MDGSNPKVSFIPKGSLVHQESFLERSRPRSVIGFIAIIAFLLSVGSYIGLFYYNDSLNQIVVQKTDEIKAAQKEFSDAPEVGEAKVFRARADLARELLNAHTVASPVFKFLSENTTESILYNRFSFKNDSTGSSLSLSGEAQNYASLAYQADVLRSKTEELTSLSISNISLTEFGTIVFTLTMSFNPDYLLYTKNLTTASAETSPIPPSSVSVETFAPTLNFDITPSLLPPAVEPPVGATPADMNPEITTPLPVDVGAEYSSATSTDTSAITFPDTTSEEPVVEVEQNQSFLKKFWSKVKFW